jgi:hypothetical protein
LTQIKSSPEIILIDITRMEQGPLNEFKASLFFEYGIKSNHYENYWEFEQYVRLAVPAIAALKAIGAAEKDSQTVIVSHEFMGMPTALAARLDPFDFKTLFYAHEVAPMRRIVEGHPGHDTMFYNVLRKAHQQDLYVNDIFGDQTSYFKYALVDAARFCDNILAVGDCVVDELKFLAPEFELADIDLTYNGIPAYEITLAEKKQSRDKLKDYCQNLLGWRPDFVFSHVTRLVLSKGLWRDLRVLEHMDKEFLAQGKTGVLLVLSTETHRRRDRDIYDMEAAYNWPVAHREGMPDLSGGEAAYYAGVQEFNAKSRAIKAIFINQFGFSRQCCGHRMPYDMEFMDIRRGSDVEFGQSIYETIRDRPAGTVVFWRIMRRHLHLRLCRLRQSRHRRQRCPQCHLRRLYRTQWGCGPGNRTHAQDRPRIPQQDRTQISQKIALEICARLPHNDDESYRLLRSGYEIAKHMGWEAVAENYVLKSIHKAVKKTHSKVVQA